MNEQLIIGISDYKVARAPQMLITYALGSCVGICLYDQKLKIGGLAHIMLPDSKMFATDSVNRMKFADTAIVDMVKDLRIQGADSGRMVAKIAGGAQMFAVQLDSPLGTIGARNIQSAKQVLHYLRIPVIEEDTGADYGRTVYFDLETGHMRIQSLNKDKRAL